MELKSMTLNTSSPVQILDFHQVDGKTMLVLNEENLAAVLKPVENLPIAIVSIVGASRQGKSFLLNFMVRYLESLSIDESDWMGWENPNTKLEGFKWCDGLDPETSGMWFWGEAFIFDSNDTKIGIILMDTQGTFDERTSTKEWSTIVGLSLLTSSCMIFNCLGNLQEDVLNSLESYVQFGRQAMEQEGSEDSIPFQKLVFLIRDWGMPVQYPYGARGGERFLQEKMRLKKEQSPQAQAVRKSIKECFEALECFLMPSPGEASKEKGFSGCISQLSDNYTKKIEMFISELLNPDEIPLKSTFGITVIGHDMINFFTKYVEMFNGDDIPSPMSIVEATARLANQTLVNKSKNIYHEHMKRKLKGVSFLPGRRFKAAHEEAKKRAINNFKNAKKIGDSDLVAEFKVIFDQVLKVEYNTLNFTNKNNMDSKIADIKQESIEEFQENMNDKYRSEEFGDEKKLLEYSSFFVSKIKEDIEDKLSELEDNELESVLEDLENKLKAEQRNFVNENTVRRVRADMFMKNLMDELSEEFSKTVIEEIQTDETLKGDELKGILNQVQNSFMDNFKSSPKKGDRAFVNKYKNYFEEELKTQGKTLAEEYLSKQTEKRVMCETLISGLLSEYKEEMLKQAERTENEAHLHEKHSELETKTLSKFEALRNSLKSKMMSDFEEVLQEKMAGVFRNCILQKHQTKLEKNEESILEAYNSALSSYKRKMESVTKSSDYYVEDDLQRCHLESNAIAKHVLIDFPKLGSNVQKKTEEMLEKLEQQTESYFENCCAQIALKKTNLEQKSLNDVTHCRKGYELEMRNSLEMARNEENLKEMHTQALGKAVKSFKDKCPIKNEAFVTTYTDMIRKEVEGVYVDLLEYYTLKMEEQAGATQRALADAKRFYHEEMKKHYINTKFMIPSTLINLHRTVSQNSLDRCCAKTHLTENQKEILLQDLETTFERYEEQNQMNIPTDPAIGIDLGTTYSCVAVYHKGKVEVIPNKEGHRTTPSYVVYKGGDLVVGDAAKSQAHENPENTIFDAKRIIGRTMTDEKLKHDITLWPFKVVEENGSPKIEADGKTYFPEQISAEILKEMKVIAEEYLKCKITKAVITVPAYFTDGQRQATIDAGELAGLEVLKIINEPTAAAIAYKQQRMDNDSRNVLIFDLGGGTFDVAVLEMSQGQIKVKAVDGDTHLGGEDFDNNLVAHCALDFAKKASIDILAGRTSDRLDVRVKSLRALRRIRNESERQKIALATANKVEVVVDSVEAGHDLRVECTRTEFETMNKTYFEKTIQIVEKVLKSAKKSKGDIDDIVLVGGSTRIPKIQEMLISHFAGKALCKNINPDEAVAVGAAIQAAILNGKIAKTSTHFNQILDVIPYSIGILIYGGDFSIIIPKNHEFPCSIIADYTTVEDDQTVIAIEVFQGEDPVAVNNTKLGEFCLNGIPPKKAGVELVNVKMEINEQGILNVTASCPSSGVTKTGLSVSSQKWRLGKETIRKILAEVSRVALSISKSRNRVSQKPKYNCNWQNT